MNEEIENIVFSSFQSNIGVQIVVILRNNIQEESK